MRLRKKNLTRKIEKFKLTCQTCVLGHKTMINKLNVKK